MAKKKSKVRPWIPPGILAAGSWVFVGAGRPLMLTVLLLATFFGVWLGAWRSVRDRVLASGRYSLRREAVEITPLPDWIDTDIRADVFRQADFDGELSLLDDRLAEEIARAFLSHPWVQEVRRVRKRHPAAVEVELVYRRPVCVVQLSSREFRAVDAEGIVLPVKGFPAERISRYPLVIGIKTWPVASEGAPWGDICVAEAARIAATFGSAWSELGLKKIVPSSEIDPACDNHHTYVLFTQNGSQIIWGCAPNVHSEGQPSAAEKVAWLRKYHKEHGTLEDIGYHNVRKLRPSAGAAGRLGKSSGPA